MFICVGLAAAATRGVVRGAAAVPSRMATQRASPQCFRSRARPLGQSEYRPALPTSSTNPIVLDNCTLIFFLRLV